MAATPIARQVPAGPYRKEGETPQLSPVTFAAGDPTNGNVIIMPEDGMLLQVRNSGAGAGTVTIASSTDKQGRKADITAFSIAAGAIVERFFTPNGWEQSFGGRDLQITPSAATIELRASPLRA